MGEFRAVDRQHENDVVHGEQVFGDLKKLDRIRRTAPVQLINHDDEGAVLMGF